MRIPDIQRQLVGLVNAAYLEVRPNGGSTGGVRSGQAGSRCPSGIHIGIRAGPTEWQEGGRPFDGLFDSTVGTPRTGTRSGLRWNEVQRWNGKTIVRGRQREGMEAHVLWPQKHGRHHQDYDHQCMRVTVAIIVAHK